MDGEATTYARELQWIVGQLCVSLRGLTAAQLNWRPDTGGATSAYGALIARLEALAAEIGAAVATLTASDLARRLRPPRELWGTGEIHEIAARDALVESIRHASVHLGELRLTRDLALRHA
jgi:hypothetical protein